MENQDNWESGDLYERFMGRWSRLTAVQFLKWLEAKHGLIWLDLGCGTGALTAVLQQQTYPRRIIGIEPSPTFVETAQSRHGNAFTHFKVGNATHISIADNAVDVLVSALAFNFFPDPQAALLEMQRVVKPGGTIALYVWDYAGEMQFLRYFWDTAVSLNPTAAEQDEGNRFPICQPEPLHQCFTEAGLQDVSVAPLDTPTHFANFTDYWQPFLGGVGPAPAPVAALAQAEQQQFEQTLRYALPIAEDGSIPLIARAWAVRGRVN